MNSEVSFNTVLKVGYSHLYFKSSSRVVTEVAMQLESEFRKGFLFLESNLSLMVIRLLTMLLILF